MPEVTAIFKYSWPQFSTRGGDNIDRQHPREYHMKAEEVCHLRASYTQTRLPAIVWLEGIGLSINRDGEVSPFGTVAMCCSLCRLWRARPPTKTLAPTA